MQKLLDIIILAIATLAGYKTKIKDLTVQLTAANDTIQGQATTIAELQQQHADDELDDDKLEEAARTSKEAAEASQAKLDELNSGLEAVNGKADELAALLNEEATAPSVDEDFNVVGGEVGSTGVGTGH